MEAYDTLNDGKAKLTFIYQSLDAELDLNEMGVYGLGQILAEVIGKIEEAQAQIEKLPQSEDQTG